eukprot:scaffold9509_cov146-Skeletonema_menzelii.AAC.1
MSQLKKRLRSSNNKIGGVVGWLRDSSWLVGHHPTTYIVRKAELMAHGLYLSSPFSVGPGLCSGYG